ncbi:MAG: tRNA pseudouridine(55) synthase TruB [Nitrosomonas sp.]|nr:tRNA pseudouridine(55) synthase TruB [Nitrosomonas sp.]
MSKPSLVNGVFLLNKPTGITSNRALQISKQLLAAAKAGHTGTLDPMAQGLLPICLGQATRFSSALLQADKTYVATMRLGYASNTGDAEGTIEQLVNVDAISAKLNFQHITDAVYSFLGKSSQIPPMYSALKKDGKALYRYAREGITIARKPREIFIYDISIDTWSGKEMTITVRCGSGTFIRTLAEDIAKKIGYGGAYLTTLVRIGIGPFGLAQANTLEQLEQEPQISRTRFLQPVDCLLQDLPHTTLDSQEVWQFQQGQAIRKATTANHQLQDGMLRVYDENNHFLGLAVWQENETLVPKKVLLA